MKKLKLPRLKRRTKEIENKRLALLAQELGVATAMVLVNDYGFSQEEADVAIKKILAQAKENRLMLTSQIVVSAYSKLNEVE